ncbi:MAG: LLM class flavin-dependent oxidoreductase [Armatimonadota bacterium]|nr:LLM class flavin-dependent oxidoreductase [Armatimonadota bacterium]
MSRLTLGVLVLGEHPVDRFTAVVRAVDEAGFDVLWLADEKFYRDPFVGLTHAAQHSHRLRLGTCVTEPYTRHPALLAMAIGTLDEVSAGRAMLGLGAGGSGFPAMGVRRARPAVAVAEAVTLVRRLLRDEHVDFQGRTVTFRDAHLHFRPRPDIPIYVAARARGMLATAGAVADGVIVAPYASLPGLRFALAQIRRGAERAGRSMTTLEVAARVDVCIADDAETARAAVKPAIALPMWISYPNLDYLRPLDLPPPPAPLLEILSRRQYDLIPEAARHVPEAYVAHLAVAGTVAQVREQLRQIVAAGVTQLLVRPVAAPGQDLLAALRLLAEQVIPAVTVEAAEHRP